MTHSWRTVCAGALGILAVAYSAMTIAPASASEQHPETAAQARTAGLHFVGFDVERAAANGWDVRTDADGMQYAVPTGTPEGSSAGATPRFDPATGLVSHGPDPTDADGTATGDCGTASFDFTSNSEFTTSYDLNGAFGPAVAHT